MPVNWAFPAAQGEPESFLAILGPIYCCKAFSWRRIFLRSEKILLQFLNRSPSRRAVPQLFLHAQ